MLKKIILFILCNVVLCSCTPQTNKINGLSFVASKDSVQTKHIIPVKKASANFVALMPFGFIKDLSSPVIHFNSKRQWFGETDAGIKQYAKKFQDEDIQVMLKPQIWVWHGAFTGAILMNSEKDWKILETSYEDFILTYAQTAAAIEATVFCIGTELENFVKHRPEFWKQLVPKIRKVYKGKLTYAANWDEFSKVSFWGELDFIGIDAYFPLTDKKTPTVYDFEQGWHPHKEKIKKIQKVYGKPILFTEFGYRSVDYTGKEPWDAKHVEKQVNITAQENGLQAIYNQFWNEPWFAGGFLWKWFHNHDEVGGMQNNRFTPQNKSTEKLIKQLYKK